MAALLATYPPCIAISKTIIFLKHIFQFFSIVLTLTKWFESQLFISDSTKTIRLVALNSGFPLIIYRVKRSVKNRIPTPPYSFQSLCFCKKRPTFLRAKFSKFANLPLIRTNLQNESLFFSGRRLDFWNKSSINLFVMLVFRIHYLGVVT